MEINIKLPEPYVNYYINGSVVICKAFYLTPLGEMKLKARAYCSPKDKFDKEFGKRLARARVELEAFNSYIRMLENTRKDLNIKISEYKVKMRQARENQAKYISGLKNS